MTWLVIVAVGVGSFAFRLGPLVLFQKVTLSERGDRMIRDGGTAAIAALITISARQSATGGAVVPTVLALAAAIVLAARGASIFLLLVCGGAIYAGAAVAMNVFVR
jgi:branched-subunit amino acid transport protein